MHYCMVVIHLIIPRVQYALHVQALKLQMSLSKLDDVRLCTYVSRLIWDLKGVRPLWWPYRCLDIHIYEHHYSTLWSSCMHRLGNSHTLLGWLTPHHWVSWLPLPPNWARLSLLPRRSRWSVTSIDTCTHRNMALNDIVTEMQLTIKWYHDCNMTKWHTTDGWTKYKLTHISHTVTQFAVWRFSESSHQSHNIIYAHLSKCYDVMETVATQVPTPHPTHLSCQGRLVFPCTQADLLVPPLPECHSLQDPREHPSYQVVRPLPSLPSFLGGHHYLQQVGGRWRVWRWGWEVGGKGRVWRWGGGRGG